MATSITAPPFSGEPEFSKETTPPFGAAGDWGNEKTILVMDPAEQAHIAWLQNTDTGEWHALDDFPVTIGRHEECGLRINDSSLSRRHASIVRLDDGGFVIEDCGSTNGIKVNDCKVDRVILAAGDAVLLGNAGFAFYLHGPDGAATSVPATRPEEADSFEALKAGVANQWRRGVAKLKRSKPRAGSKGAGFAGVTQWAKDHPGTSVFAVALVVLLSAGFLYNAAVLERVSPVPVPVVDEGASGNGPTGEAPSDVIVDAIAESAEVIFRAASSAMRPDVQIPLIDADGPVVDLGEVEVRVSAAGQVRQEDGAAKTASPAATPVPPKRHKPNLVSAEQSEKRIANSLVIYSGGNAPDALVQLIEMSNSKTHGRQYREQAHEVHQRVAAAYGDYEKGKQALEGGDKNLAFAAWLEFLKKEAALLDGQKSAYARAVNDEVAREYTDQGNQAEAEERFQDAHRLWRQAAQLQPAGAAAGSIDRLQARAKQHYLDGYRLESANISKAREHWLKSVALAAPGTEYSTKSKAKLRWYGVRGTETGSE